MRLRDGSIASFYLIHLDELPAIVGRGIEPPERAPRRRLEDPVERALRSETPVGAGPGGTLAHYVPLLLGPRGPALFRIAAGQVEGYADGQAPIVTLVVGVQAVLAGHRSVITDGDPLVRLTRSSDAPDALGALDWASIDARQWSDTPESPDRQRRKAAELLVHQDLPWTLVRGIAARDAAARDRAEAILEEAGAAHLPQVAVLPDLYHAELARPVPRRVPPAPAPPPPDPSGIHRGSGELLDSRADALVAPVSAEGDMGSGVALRLRRAWPALYEAVRGDARAGRLAVGQIAAWRTGGEAPRFVLALPTRRSRRARALFGDLDAGLRALAETARTLGLRSLALPALGVEDGLDWAVVRPRIAEIFGPLVAEGVEIVLWEPEPEGPVGDLERSGLTPSRAALLELMQRYSASGYALTPLEAQKLAYFLQEAGEPLRMLFRSERYGPFADGVEALLIRMEGHQIRGHGDRRPGATLRVQPDAAQEAALALRGRSGPQQRIERVARTIRGLATPWGLELLAAVHWVSRQDPNVRGSGEAALRAVRAWSPRPRQVFEPHQVDLVWERLREEDWL